MKKSILVLLALPVFAFLLIATTGFLLDFRQRETLETLTITGISMVYDGVAIGGIQEAEPTEDGRRRFILPQPEAGTRLRLYFGFYPPEIQVTGTTIGASVENASVFVHRTGNALQYDVRFYVEFTFTGVRGNSNIDIFARHNREIGDGIRVVMA